MAARFHRAYPSSPGFDQSNSTNFWLCKSGDHRERISASRSRDSDLRDLENAVSVPRRCKKSQSICWAVFTGECVTVGRKTQ